jgi:hypothetical protein
MKRLSRRLALLAGILGVNAAIIAAAPPDAHPRGECVYESAFHPCYCDDKIVYENCHLDSDCDWGICA